MNKTPSIGANQIEVSEICGKALGTRIVSRNCQFLSKSQVLSVNSKFILHGDLHESMSIQLHMIKGIAAPQFPPEKNFNFFREIILDVEVEQRPGRR